LTWPIGDKEKDKRIIAPIREIIQYVSICIFPILIFGKNRTEVATSRTVIIEITIVAIIANDIIYQFLQKW